MAGIGGNVFGSSPNYGNVTNPLAMTSAFSQLKKLYPGLSQTTGLAESDLSSELAGSVPQDVQSQIKDAGAQWGLQTGMPGSGAAGNYTLEQLGLNSMQEQQQGFNNYLSFVPALQQHFTESPEQVASTDTAQSAPNPASAGAANLGTEIGGGVLSLLPLLALL